MNNFEKSLKRIRTKVEPADYWTEEDWNHYKTLIKALEKQVPEDPVEVDEKSEEDFYFLSFICPSCKQSVFNQPYKPNHCKHCGQALKW